MRHSFEVPQRLIINIRNLKKQGQGQLMHYLATQLRYRRDLSSVIGLLVYRNGYQALRLDACSKAQTETYHWGTKSMNLLPLLQYVAAIYDSECQKDTTWNYILGSQQMWRAEICGQAYICRPIFAAKPLGRMTRVDISYRYNNGKSSHDMAKYIIKTSFVDQSSRFQERLLLEQAHKGGFIPGLARLVAAENSKGLVKGGGLERRKQTIVLGSIGEPLSQCTSVLELLKVVYDAVVSECNSHSA